MRRLAASGASLLAVPLLLLAGCTPASPAPPVEQVEANARNAPTPQACIVPDHERKPPTSRAGYFPLALTEQGRACGFPQSCTPILSGFMLDWFSRHLEAAGEPSLHRESQRPGAAAGDGRTIRFTWLPSFHNSVTVRVEHVGASYRLIAKRLSGAGGYDPGTVKAQIDRPLTAEESAGLIAAIERTRLFALPPDPCTIGLDGSEWLFESVDGGEYQFVQRWSPEDGPVREIGMLLLELTGWQFDEVY